MSATIFHIPLLLNQFSHHIPKSNPKNQASSSWIFSHVSGIRERFHSIFSKVWKVGSIGALALALGTGAPSLNTNGDRDVLPEVQASRTDESSLALKWSPTLTLDTLVEDVVPLKSSNIIRKRVPAEHFEKAFMKYVGTPYKLGVTDCSGIIQKVLRNLGVIGESTFTGSAANIFNTLTIDKRSPIQARPGDFFYWIPRNDQSSRHIAYVASVGADGVWVIDSSTDHHGTSKRFMSWKKVAEKEWFVGAPAFLIKNTVQWA